MRILGLSAFYHDSAAALLVDGRVVAAAQEERFTRKKHDHRFPAEALQYCLKASSLRLDELDYVVFFEKPFLKFERLLETYLGNAPRGFSSFRFAMPVWIKDKLFQKINILKELRRFSPSGSFDEKKLLFSDHHQSHASSAYFPSPFEEAVVLTLDGVGEWTTASVSIGRANTLTRVREIRWPHSLGMLYSAFTYYTGFKVNSGEYKVMGLAPYGQPKFADLIFEHIVDLRADGSFWLDMSYFNYVTGLTMTTEKFHRLFGGPPRDPETWLTQREMDLAASIQAVTEEIMLRITRDLARAYRIENLCLAGGVALNCVANGKIARDGAFKRIWVQPAAGDAGAALGAALAAHFLHAKGERTPGVSLDAMQGAYLGPHYDQADIENRLTAVGASFTVIDTPALLTRTCEALCAGQVVGWFQGRMEFGPRALGARSILADARNPAMQRNLNLKIKFRESFRPFAAAVLAEDAEAYFEHRGESPYMLIVAKVRSERCVEPAANQGAHFGIDKLNEVRSDIPAVTHVDWSTRIQTVHRETNPLLHDLLLAFKERTACSVLANTSFNVRGEPIVCTPEDAFRCFMGTEMEALIIGNCFLSKSSQSPELRHDYKDKFERD